MARFTDRPIFLLLRATLVLLGVGPTLVIFAATRIVDALARGFFRLAARLDRLGDRLDRVVARRMIRASLKIEAIKRAVGL